MNCFYFYSTTMFSKQQKIDKKKFTENALIANMELPTINTKFPLCGAYTPRWESLI